MAVPLNAHASMVQVGMCIMHILNSLCRISLSDCQSLGSVHKTVLDVDARQANSQFNIDVEVGSSFSRAVVNQVTYYSTSHKRSKTRNSYTIEYVEEHTSKFGFINHSLQFSVVTPLNPTFVLLP